MRRTLKRNAYIFTNIRVLNSSIKFPNHFKFNLEPQCATAGHSCRAMDAAPGCRRAMDAAPALPQTSTDDIQHIKELMAKGASMCREVLPPDGPFPDGFEQDANNIAKMESGC